jgi:Flp pilus assembly pilin Flp
MRRNDTTREIAPTGELGQTMAEYAVVLGVITLAIVTSFALLSGAIEAAIDATVDLYDLIV